MELLSADNTDFLHDWLIQNGIEYDHLKTDLLDHICCMIEDRMKNGEDFNTAFEFVEKEFKKNELQDIQEATIYLITLKQQNMKKATGILGIISTLTIITGVIFKIMHWPMASILLILGLSTVSILIIPLMALIELKTKNSILQKLTSSTGFLAAILLSLATLFRIMHWPGFNFLSTGGFIMLGFIFIPMFTYKRYKQSDNKIMSIALSMLIFTGIFLFWTFYPISTEKVSAENTNHSVQVEFQD